MKSIILFVLLKFMFVISLTCDFHLVEQNPDILKHLPEECQNISKDDPLYKQMIDESLLFLEFQKNLNQYEKDNDESYIESSGEEGKPVTIPNKDWELRAKTYDEIKLYDCESVAEIEKTYAEIIECLIEKRKAMLPTPKINN